MGIFQQLTMDRHPLPSDQIVGRLPTCSDRKPVQVSRICGHEAVGSEIVIQVDRGNPILGGANDAGILCFLCQGMNCDARDLAFRELCGIGTADLIDINRADRQFH